MKTKANATVENKKLSKRSQAKLDKLRAEFEKQVIQELASMPANKLGLLCRLEIRGVWGGSRYSSVPIRFL